MNSTEPYVALGVIIHDGDALQTDAHAAAGDDGKPGVIAAVRIGIVAAVGIQSSSPAALRRLAAALNDAADKAEAITEAGK